MFNVSWKVSMAVIIVMLTFMGASYTMLIPFLPMYLIQELGVAVDDVNGWSGIIFSITFFISSIMAPVWGIIADRSSRKLMAIRSAFFLSVAYFLGGFVQTPLQLFAMRAFQGLAAGLWPMLLAILSATVPKERLGVSLGFAQAAHTAGTILGPLAGGVLAECFGMRASFYLAGTWLFLITLSIILFIREPAKKERKEKAVTSSASAILRIPAVQLMLVTACVVQLSIVLVQPVLPLYIADLQHSMERIVLVSGIVFSVSGISGIFASPVWGAAGQRWGCRQMLFFSLACTMVIGIVQAIPQNIPSFTALRLAFGFAFAGIYPLINAILTQSTEPGDRGKAFGYTFSAQQMGSILGPVLGGFAASGFGNQAAIAASGAVLLPVVLIVAFFCLRKNEKADSPL